MGWARLPLEGVRQDNEPPKARFVYEILHDFFIDNITVRNVEMSTFSTLNYKYLSYEKQELVRGRYHKRSWS